MEFVIFIIVLGVAVVGLSAYLMVRDRKTGNHQTGRSGSHDADMAYANHEVAAGIAQSNAHRSSGGLF